MNIEGKTETMEVNIFSVPHPKVGQKVTLSGMGEWNGEWTVIDLLGETHIKIVRRVK